MRKLVPFIIIPILCLLAIVSFGIDNGPVQIDNTGNNVTYRSIRLVGRFPLFTSGSNQFVMSNITSYASQSNLQNTAVVVLARSIMSFGGSQVSSAGGTNALQWVLGTSINGSDWKTNTYTGSNAMNGTTPVLFFNDLDTNLLAQYVALAAISTANLTNCTGYFYFQFRAAP